MIIMDMILNLEDFGMEYLFVEDAEISVKKAALAMDTYQQLSELNERSRTLQQYTNADSIFCEAGENAGSKKNLLIRMWEAIKKFAQKIWDWIKKRKSRSTLDPQDTIVVKKPFATAIKTIKGLWARVKSAALNVKSDLTKNGNWKKLIAVIAAATIIGGTAVVFVKRRKKKNQNSQKNINRALSEPVATSQPVAIAQDTNPVVISQDESVPIPPDCVEISGQEVIQAQSTVEEIIKTAEVHASKEVEVIKKTYDKDMVDDHYSKIKDVGNRYEKIAKKEMKKAVGYRDGIDDLEQYETANALVILWNNLLGHIKDFNKQLDMIIHLPTDEKAEKMAHMKKAVNNIESDAMDIRNHTKTLTGRNVSHPDYFGSLAPDATSGMASVLNLLRDFK